MYPISSAVKALFDAEQRQVLRITGTDSNGTPIHITDENVMMNGFNIDRYSCNGEKLEIGTAIASEMTLKLDNRQGQFNGIKFEGAELFVEIGIADWSEEEPTIAWIPCGYFTPDEQPRSLSIITIHALDRMMKFDVDIDISEINLPSTIAELIVQCCSICEVGFTQYILDLPNALYSISALPDIQQKITYRNIIQWCAGIMCVNAWIDWNGDIRFSWYNSMTDYVSNKANRFNSDLYEDDIQITGIKYTNTQDYTIVFGTSDYAIDLTGNYLASNGIVEIMPNILLAINGFTYRPFSATVINTPYLWPMDMITFVDKDNVNHACAITNVNYGINCESIIAGKGETSQTNSLSSPNGITKEQARLFNTISEDVTGLDESLNQAEIFKRITDNGRAQGVYLVDGQIYINGTFIQAGEIDADKVKVTNLDVSDIRTGLIHSADYAVEVIQKIYPLSTLYPSSTVYSNNGERVISGFAIDFVTGQIYGGFFSEQIADLEDAVSDIQDAIVALQNALVYPKAVPSMLSFAPNLSISEDALEQESTDSVENEEDDE